MKLQYNRDSLRSECEGSIVKKLSGKSGIYRIILCDKSGINRLIGSDERSLMYIGHAKTKNTLLKRVRDFFDSASNVNAEGNPPTTHTAGRYYQLYLKSQLGDALTKLKFEFVVTSSDELAVKLEREELSSYLARFGELPPLNHQLPKAI